MTGAVDRACRRWRLIARVGTTALAFLVSMAAASTARSEDVTITVGPVTSGVPSPVLWPGAGVWRIPRIQDEIGNAMLQSPRLGMIRAALAWEVLAASTSMEDLKARLKTYGLNDFLVAAGKRDAVIVITLDAMPRWLASDKSDRMLPDGPAWAKSAPSDFGIWSNVVAEVVRHFSGNLGLSPYYEVWNEPDWSYAGGVPAYLRLYGATVAGARSVAADARIAGPSISDITSAATTSGEGLWLREFLRGAAEASLPVDAVTWHSFYREPGMYHALAAPTIRRWLTEAGFAARTPLFLNEWNIAASPPYPEGDLNGSHVGAAYSAAAAIAMDRNEVTGQAYQMIADPGTPGYTAGLFSIVGVPRPAFHAFRLLTTLEGRRVSIATDHPFVHAVAFAEPREIHIVIAVMVPTDGMLIRSAFDVAIDDPDAARHLRELDVADTVRYLLNGGSEPRIPAGAEAVFRRSEALFASTRALARRWSEPFDIALSLDTSLAPSGVLHYEVIDRHTAIDEQSLHATSIRLQGAALDAIAASEQNLVRGGISTDVVDRWKQDTTSGRAGEFEWAQPPVRAILVEAYRAARSAFGNVHAEVMSTEMARSIAPPPRLSGNRIVLRSEPHAVHLLTIRRD